MKKILMTLVLAIATMAVPMNAQAAPKNDTVPEIEVFSDTTSADSAAIADDFGWDDEDFDEWESADTQTLMGKLGFNNDLLDMLGGIIIVFIVLFLIFILAPVAVIGIILYFIYKNRKERMRVMEAAIKNGKEIPMDALGTPYAKNDDIWNKGIKQMFLGVGLAFLLWIPLGKLGLAIGALIFFIGCGNVVISYSAKQKQKEKEMREQFSRKETDIVEPQE
jgi:hypothetical protein